MNISNRLCNATPFNREWDYDKGIKIPVPANGFVDLDRRVMEDFMPDQPGAEAVQELMKHEGIFLRDPTRTYESQAVEALEACVASREAMYKDVHGNLRRRAAAQGTYDEKAFTETLDNMGYTKLKEDTDVIKKRLKIYMRKLGDSTRPVHQQHDPEKTLLWKNPPMEFESKVAMEVYLEENDKERAEHQLWLKSQNEAEVGPV